MSGLITYKPLTRGQLASMPAHVREARIEHWRTIIAALQDDHWRRYPDVLRGRRGGRSGAYPIMRAPLPDFDGVGATLARGFRESA